MDRSQRKHTQGFVMPDNIPKDEHASAPSRPLLGGFFILAAILMAAWGFSQGSLEPDQRWILVWMLAMASGAGAWSFSGSLAVQGHELITRLAVTATGGFAVWLLTFFLLPLPATHERSLVRIYLDNAGKILAEDFVITVRIPGMETITKKGANGETTIELPSTVRQVDNISIECPGYRMISEPPYNVTDNIIRLSLVPIEPISFGRLEVGRSLAQIRTGSSGTLISTGVFVFPAEDPVWILTSRNAIKEGASKASSSDNRSDLVVAWAGETRPVSEVRLPQREDLGLRPRTTSGAGTSRSTARRPAVR
jgi:hypothetical protein